MSRPSHGGSPLYDCAFEHDACGIGFVASRTGERTHRLIQLALRGLTNLTHRGAVAADSVSGDGAGLTIQLPHALLAADAARLGLPGHDIDRLAVAMVFLPRDDARAEAARTVLEDAVVATDVAVVGWRPVPIDESILGSVARCSLPRIEQLLLASPAARRPAETESALYVARKKAEATYRERGIEDAYVVSMSSRTVVYKGLMTAPDLGRFFPDLTDRRATSALAIFHQRFATNTHPVWRLAQPFRRIAHNGEVNTLLGNRNWMTAREPELIASRPAGLEELMPVLTPGGSDTAALDEALDLLVTSGRDTLESMAILVPEAWEKMPGLDHELRSFYQYYACLMEPWDGPASVVFTDGRMVAASMDRNGLRPARYQVTSDDLVVVGSEVGILDLPPGEIVESGRVGPGQMVAVDTASGRFLRNDAIKRELAGRRPYSTWLRDNLRHLDAVAPELRTGERPAPDMDPSEIERLQVLHGYTREELSLVLGPMATDGKEPVGSMGDDTPLSVLSEKARPLYAYFRQRFAQVTNPPIDSIRERVVMSLDTYLGRRGSILDPTPGAARLLHLPGPIITAPAIDVLRDQARSGLSVGALSAVFDVDGGGGALEQALERLCAEAASLVQSGTDTLIVSDRAVSATHAPIPMLLAVSAVHQHLIAAGLRMRASIVAEAGDARDVHHFAALVGFGASTVSPYLALDTVAATATGEGADPTEASRRFVRASEAGILKVMSKMGIATISSYHGAQIFESLGLGQELLDRYFPGMRSRIGGIGLAELARDVASRHRSAFGEAELDGGGWYRYRRSGEYHANEPPVWRALHAAVKGGGRDEYRIYSDLVHQRPPTAIRDLLTFASDRDPIDLDTVEPVEAITRRFQTGAMSLGALSAEAHEDVARAMNRLGAQSNSGEGGEDPARYSPDGPKRDAISRIKQVASGRFGVTTTYLASATELEIKMAQGSKPGEGGQLPGRKVSAYIARMRHVAPATPLISPPPHHDIYSIEDLAQLIHDLKTVNPRARVSVKLVSSEGVGTIAAGVAKAYADVIHISGADGGTGASPLSSVKHAGDPWELGLAEAQQTLVLNGLRGRVTLTTDGGLHTGRDVVKAALLGAERYGFGTAALIALGCKMARQCHSNTCPVGIATQAEELRRKYFGTPEMLLSFFTGLATEVREILAWLGYRALDDVIGRSDLLTQIDADDTARWRGVDLSKLTVAPGEGPLRDVGHQPPPPATSLDDRVLADLGPLIAEGGDVRAEYPIRNTDRTVGSGISGRIAELHGDAGLPIGSIDLRFVGTAGQSFGAWLVDGIWMSLEGEANDYVAKGMTGGEIAIRVPERSGIERSSPNLVGNTVMYGATGGGLYVAGRAGERFAVRNSGGHAVVEGVGKHGCEYMTGGVVVVLGKTGRNFGAGMSGGCAYVLDEAGDFRDRLNPALVDATPVTSPAHARLLRSLIERHLQRTDSPKAREVLSGWPRALPGFWRVAPRIVQDVTESAPEAASGSRPAIVSTVPSTPATPHLTS